LGGSILLADLVGLQVMEEERLAAAMDIYWRVRNAEPEGE
jgi:hypothetical protein